MRIEPLPGPAGLFNVSVAPRFIHDSGRVGWQGSFFTHIVGAPFGSVDQAHTRLCLMRSLDAIELRRVSRASWDVEMPGLSVWQSGDEQRADWRGRCRGQFLFVDDAHVEQILDGSPWRSTRNHWTQGTSRVAELILNAIVEDLASGSPAGPTTGEALIAALVANVAGLPDAPAKRLPRSAQDRVTDYIEAHLEQALTLATLSDIAGTGVRHFSRAFLASIGQSPHQYVIGRRVERARGLIARGLPLADVALACGFADQSQLTRSFSSRVGLTPARYRATLSR